MNWLQSLERLLLTLWIGGMIFSGYVAAPLLFAHLSDRTLAGTLAGSLFHAMAIIGLVCGIGLLIMSSWSWRDKFLQQWRNWILLVMVLITAIGLFYLQPTIETLRDSGEAAKGSQLFKQLHGTASVLYLLSSCGGLLLVMVGVQRRNDATD